MCDAAGKRLARLIMKAIKPPSVKKDPVEELPEEILHLIWRLLDLNDLLSASLVCRSWNLSLSNDNVWKRYINKSEVKKCPTSSVRPTSSAYREDNSRTSWKKKFLSQRSLAHNWLKNKYHTEIKTPITGKVSATNELLCIWSDKSVDLISPLNTSISTHISNQFTIKSVQTTKDSDLVLIITSNHFAHLYKSDKTRPLLSINLIESGKSSGIDSNTRNRFNSGINQRNELVNNNDFDQFRENSSNSDSNRLNENLINNNETENINNELGNLGELVTNQERVDQNQLLNDTLNQVDEGGEARDGFNQVELVSHQVDQSYHRGNQSNQQGDRVENLTNHQGNLSMRQDISNQIGNQFDQLGNPSNQQRNQSNQQGDQSNQQGNQSNQQGNQLNQLGNQSNSRTQLNEPNYEVKLTSNYLCVYKSEKFSIYDLADFSEKSIQIPECKKISSFNLLKSAILVRFEPLDYNYEAIYTIYDFGTNQWSVITKISTTPLGHREHFEYIFNDYYLLVNYLLIEDTYMYSNVYIYNKLKPINREIISNNHRKYFIADFTTKLCIFTVADYRLLALDLTCCKTKEIYVTANFTDLFTVLNRFFVLKFSDRIEVWDVKLCKRLYSIRFSDRDNVLVRDKFIAVTSFPGTSLPRSLRLLNFTEPELCDKPSSVNDLSNLLG